MKKRYYQLTLTQTTPLRVGIGESFDSDADVATDGRGAPFIPGSSLTGVLRTYFNKMDADLLFGCIGDSRQKESLLLVSDACLPTDTEDGRDYVVTVRDGVGLNENGTAAKRAKYDFEVVESKRPYKAVLELDDSTPEALVSALEAVLTAICRDGISYGARTTRGYGRMRVSVQKRTFTFPDKLAQWLDFDPFADSFGGKPLAVSGEWAERAGTLRIVLGLRMSGSFAVRKYTSRLKKANEEAAPDYSYLSNMDRHPVIPGTSWAGCFRHHMLQLAHACYPGEALGQITEQVNTLFGKTAEKQRSKIRFSEMTLQGSKSLRMTRNAVDRFTAAPRNRGLYTAELAWGGSGQLEIELPADTEPILLQLLALSINDLSLGLLPVGGASGVGRGVCTVEKLTVCGQDQTEEMNRLGAAYLMLPETEDREEEG